MHLNTVTERITKYLSREPQNFLKSKQTSWNALNLIERFSQPKYHSDLARTTLLTADAAHFAQEFLLVRPITQLSYQIELASSDSLTAPESGYQEALTTYTANFVRDLSKNGLAATRATIEHVTLQKIQEWFKTMSTQDTVECPALLVTSFPDETALGYHGSDSKYFPHDPTKKEKHHSFYYLMRISGKNTQSITITTTQYRVWHNAHQAVSLHSSLGQPIETLDAPVPNLLFANVIPLTAEKIQILANTFQKNTALKPPEHFPDPSQEELVEQLFRNYIYRDAHTHSYNHTQRPYIDEADFWETYTTEDGTVYKTPELFNSFYIPLALPLFSQATELYTRLKKAQLYVDRPLQKKLATELQLCINELDRLFFYYQRAAFGSIRLKNKNEKYTEYLKKNKKQTAREWLTNKILGLTDNSTTSSLSAQQLKEAFRIEQELRLGAELSQEQKEQLLSVWRFFFFAGSVSGLIQCGVLAPFTLPLSVLKNGSKTASQGGFFLGNFRIDGYSRDTFTESLSELSIFDKQLLLNTLTQETYVELDLRSKGAKTVWSVPKSYLEKNGCVVGKDGEVLGPCIDPKTKQRISLSDPRDTMAFPIFLTAFQEKIEILKQQITISSTNELEESIENLDTLSDDQKKQARALVKKLYSILFKKTLGLDALFNGVVVSANHSLSPALQSLALQLNFTKNPLLVLKEAVQQGMKNQLSLEHTELLQEISTSH